MSIRAVIMATIRGFAMKSSRRDFVKQTAVAETSCILPANGRETLLAAGEPANPPSTDGGTGWYSRPMRWAQLAFVEDDPGNYDQAFWLDYFHRIHADAACLGAGGVVAFYPTDIPLHQ